MQWHSLQSCVQTRTRRWRALPHRRSQNPNPAALLAFLRASPPLCSPRCLRAAVAAPRAAFGAFVRPSWPSCGPGAFVQPSLPLCDRCRPSCGLRRLCAALVAVLRASPSSCGPRRLRAALASFVRSSPPSRGPSSSPPHTSLGPVFPAGASSCGRPPRMPAAPSVQPAPS